LRWRVPTENMVIMYLHKVCC